MAYNPKQPRDKSGRWTAAYAHVQNGSTEFMHVNASTEEEAKNLARVSLTKKYGAGQFKLLFMRQHSTHAENAALVKQIQQNSGVHRAAINSSSYFTRVGEIFKKNAKKNARA